MTSEPTVSFHALNHASSEPGQRAHWTNLTRQPRMEPRAQPDRINSEILEIWFDQHKLEGCVEIQSIDISTGPSIIPKYFEHNILTLIFEAKFSKRKVLHVLVKLVRQFSTMTSMKTGGDKHTMNFMLLHGESISHPIWCALNHHKVSITTKMINRIMMDLP